MFMTHEGDDGDRQGRRVHRRDRRALRPRGPLGLPGAARERALLRDERRSSSTASIGDAALIVNMHGGTLPLPEHAATERLVFLGTDPVEVELEVERGDQRSARVPRPARRRSSPGASTSATRTVGCRGRARTRSFPARRRWSSTSGTTTSSPTVRRSRRSATGASPTATSAFEGRVYRWSKHQQFLKILDLPLQDRGADRARAVELRGPGPPAARRARLAGAARPRGLPRPRRLPRLHRRLRRARCRSPRSRTSTSAAAGSASAAPPTWPPAGR